MAEKKTALSGEVRWVRNGVAKYNRFDLHLFNMVYFSKIYSVIGSGYIYCKLPLRLVSGSIFVLVRLVIILRVCKFAHPQQNINDYAI